MLTRRSLRIKTKIETSELDTTLENEKEDKRDLEKITATVKCSDDTASSRVLKRSNSLKSDISSPTNQASQSKRSKVEVSPDEILEEEVTPTRRAGRTRNLSVNESDKLIHSPAAQRAKRTRKVSVDIDDLSASNSVEPSKVSSHDDTCKYATSLRPRRNIRPVTENLDEFDIKPCTVQINVKSHSLLAQIYKKYSNSRPEDISNINTDYKSNLNECKEFHHSKNENCKKLCPKSNTSKELEVTSNNIPEVNVNDESNYEVEAKVKEKTPPPKLSFSFNDIERRMKAYPLLFPETRVKDVIDMRRINRGGISFLSGDPAKIGLGIGPKGKKNGLSSVVQALQDVQLEKAKRLGTIDATRIDWIEFKKKEGIEEELLQQTRSKHSYVDRQEFLQRTDYRQFEIEKEIRANIRRKNETVNYLDN